MTQRDRMLAGQLYDASDADLVRRRMRARELTARYNATAGGSGLQRDTAVNGSGFQRDAVASGLGFQPDAADLRASLLRELLGHCGEIVIIEPPFHCDYGENIELADNVSLNFNCIMLDCAPIRLGRNVMVGPAVQFYAAYHPLAAAERIKGPELAAPITVGDNVWIGGGAILLPGVTIGESTTIGAGSVVTGAIPANVLAVGNPCRIVRKLA